MIEEGTAVLKRGIDHAAPQLQLLRNFGQQSPGKRAYQCAITIANGYQAAERISKANASLHFF